MEEDYAQHCFSTHCADLIFKSKVPLTQLIFMAEGTLDFHRQLVAQVTNQAAAYVATAQPPAPPA
jgi:hypothetical protein